MSATYSVNPEIDNSLSANRDHYDLNGSQTTYRTYPASSWSDVSYNVAIIPPSMSVYINRAIQKIIPLTITWTGTSGSGDLLKDGYDALRSIPDIRMTSNEVISINGIGYPSSQVSDTYSEILLHYDREFKKMHPLSAPDMSQNYNDAIGTVNNPLSSYANSETWEGGAKRGSYQVVSLTRSGSSAVMVVNLIGWLYVPELLGVQYSEQMGLSRVRQIDVVSNINLGTNAKFIVSHNHSSADTVGGAAMTVTCTMGQPKFLVKYITPPMELMPQGPLRYKTLRMERHITKLGSTLAANAQTALTLNNIQFPYIPRYVWMYVRESDANKTFESTDTCARVDNVSINFANQSALLSSATPQDLYVMCKQTGLIDSYPMFSGLANSSNFVKIGTVGSFCCFEFGRHISLGSGGDLAIGTPGQFNFNATVTFTNVNQSASITDPSLYCIVAYDLDMVIDDGGLVTFENPVGQSIQGLGEGEGGVVKVPYNVQGLGGMTAGAGWKDLIKKIDKWLQDKKLLSKLGHSVAPLAGPLEGVVKEAAKYAEDKGYGGARASGGANMSAKELKRLVGAL